MARRTIAAIITYAVGRGTLADAPHVNHKTLAAKGFTPDKIATVEAGLAAAFDIKFVFNKWYARRGILHQRSLQADARNNERTGLRPARGNRLLEG